MKIMKLREAKRDIGKKSLVLFTIVSFMMLLVGEYVYAGSAEQADRINKDTMFRSGSRYLKMDAAKGEDYENHNKNQIELKKDADKFQVNRTLDKDPTPEREAARPEFHAKPKRGSGATDTQADKAVEQATVVIDPAVADDILKKAAENNATVTRLDNGNHILAWTETGESGETKAYFSIIDPQGNVVRDRQEIAVEADSDYVYVSDVTDLGNGRFSATVYSYKYESSQRDQGKYRYYSYGYTYTQSLRVFNSNGTLAAEKDFATNYSYEYRYKYSSKYKTHIYDKTISYSYSSDSIGNVTKLGDGNIAISVNHYEYTNNSSYQNTSSITVLDRNLNTVAEDNLSNDTYLQNIVATGDGGFAAVTYSYSSTSSQRNQGKYRYYNYNYTSTQSVRMYNSSGNLQGTQDYKSTSEYEYRYKKNSKGQYVYDKTINYNYISNYIGNITSLGNGNIAIAVNTYSYDMESGSRETSYIRVIDSGMNTVSEDRLGESTYVENIIALGDGGFAATTYSYSYDSSERFEGNYRYNNYTSTTTQSLRIYDSSGTLLNDKDYESTSRSEYRYKKNSRGQYAYDKTVEYSYESNYIYPMETLETGKLIFTLSSYSYAYNGEAQAYTYKYKTSIAALDREGNIGKETEITLTAGSDSYQYIQDIVPLGGNHFGLITGGYGYDENKGMWTYTSTAAQFTVDGVTIKKREGGENIQLVQAAEPTEYLPAKDLIADREGLEDAEKAVEPDRKPMGITGGAPDEDKAARDRLRNLLGQTVPEDALSKYGFLFDKPDNENLVSELPGLIENPSEKEKEVIAGTEKLAEDIAALNNKELDNAARNFVRAISAILIVTHRTGDLLDENEILTIIDEINKQKQEIFKKIALSPQLEGGMKKMFEENMRALRVEDLMHNEQLTQADLMKLAAGGNRANATIAGTKEAGKSWPVAMMAAEEAMNKRGFLKPAMRNMRFLLESNTDRIYRLLEAISVLKKGQGK